MVGDEIDAFADPARRGDIRIEREQPAEVAATFHINPQVTRRATTIAFPKGRLRCIAAEHEATMWTECKAMCNTIRQLHRLAARRRHRKELGKAARWLPRTAPIHNSRAISTPPRRPGACSLERE